MNKFAEFMNAYADELAKHASGLSNLCRELTELRDAMADVVRDERQPSLQLGEDVR